MTAGGLWRVRPVSGVGRGWLLSATSAYSSGIMTLRPWTSLAWTYLARACRLAVFIALATSTTAGAYEAIRFDRLSADDGLSNNDTFTIVQDRMGFIWIGARYGLNRYDGSSVVQYIHDEKDEHSISDNFVQHLLEGADGAIWAGTWGGGLNRYDPATDRFTRFRHDDDDPASLSNDNVWSSYEDRSGTLWIATENGLNRFDPQTGGFKHFLHDPNDPASLSNNSVTTVRQDSAGTFWVATYGGGLNRFDPARGSFTPFRNDPADPDSLSNDNIWNFHLDQNDVLWLGTEAGLNRFDPRDGRFTAYRYDASDPDSLSNDTVAYVADAGNGRLWVSTTGGGGNLFDPATGKFRRFLFNAADDLSLSYNLAWCATLDRSGALWVATTNGVSKYDPGAHQFDTRRPNAADPRTTAYSDIQGFYEDADGVLWIGSGTSGLSRLNPDDSVAITYKHDDADPTSLSGNAIGDVEGDANGYLWVSTDNGLNRFDPTTGRFIRFRNDPDNANSPQGNNVTDLEIDETGAVWMAIYGYGFARLDPATGKFDRFDFDEREPAGLSTRWITMMELAADGSVWAGGDGGLSRFDPATHRYTNFTGGGAGGLSNSIVLDIFEDSRQVIWVATGDGLNRFDPQTNSFTSFHKKDGLPSNQVIGIIEDLNGYLWVSTNSGISRIDPRTNTFRNHDPGDGLVNDQFNARIADRTRDGRLLFGRELGFTAFDPDTLQDNQNVPPVVLTDFQLFNELVRLGENSVLDVQIGLADTLTLSHDDTVFSFEFAALNYRRPEKNQYAYKMEGFDGDWRFTSSARRFATYTNLDPGSYVFRVKASNDDGLWNETGTALPITILPPWWMTGWFRALVAMTLLGATASIFLWQRRAGLRRERVLQRLVTRRTHELEIARDEADAANKAKSLFLSSMSHELRTPLNGILGYAQVLKRRGLGSAVDSGLDIIHQSAAHLLTVINDILDLSKIEAGKLDLYPREVNLPVFLRTIIAIVRARAEAKGGVDLSLEALSPLPETVTADETRLRQVLLNLLDNAVKFTDAGAVTLTVDSKPAHLPGHARLSFEVRDSGKGIPPGMQALIFEPFAQVPDTERLAEGTGLGLPICRKILQMMGSDLAVESPSPYSQASEAPGSVFRFEVVLPVVERALAPQTSGARHIAGYRGTRRRILVVDDKQQNRQVLTDMLAPLGFSIETAVNGQDAVSAVLADPPDMVLMDLVMPVMTGFEAIRQIRQNEALRELPIVAVSASVLDLNESLKVGCQDFLAKPVSFDKLLEVLEELLKLDWIVRDAPRDGDAVLPAPADSDRIVTPPPLTDIALLRGLVEDGNMRGVVAWAARLAEDRPDLSAFSEAVTQMAMRFEDRNLLSFIAKFEAEGEVDEHRA